MTEQPKTMDGADRVVIPFLPALRKKLGERLASGKQAGGDG
jgi:hypothetical protein